MVVFKRYPSFQGDILTAAAFQLHTYFTPAHSAEKNLSPNLLDYRMCARSSGG